MGKNLPSHGSNAGTPKVRKNTKHVNIKLDTLRMERNKRDVQIILTSLKN